jgi:hypothetical protein
MDLAVVLRWGPSWGHDRTVVFCALLLSVTNVAFCEPADCGVLQHFKFVAIGEPMSRLQSVPTDFTLAFICSLRK